MVEIVAEIGSAHNGYFGVLCDLIRVAAECGCDYAKFQFYRPEDMPDLHEGDNEAMYHKLMVPDVWLPELFRVAKGHGIGLFASVFSVRAVRELLKYDVPYIKLASPKSTRLSQEVYEQIIEAVPAKVGLIASADAGDFDQMSYGFPRMLYCPEGHPPELNESHFREFAKRKPGGSWLHSGRAYYGFSDHTPDISTPLAFIRAGAKMIEKHLKLDDDCVDAAFSADPETMKLLCRLAKNT